jgi:hypothetical protein
MNVALFSSCRRSREWPQRIDRVVPSEFRSFFSHIAKSARCALLPAVLLPVAVLHAQSNYATPYTFTTLAGTAGVSGSADGTGSAARFNGPSGLAVDNLGNIYVADYSNHTIREITPAGVVTTLAGSAGNPGSTDGTGSVARFNNPSGVAADNTGNVYVADYSNHTIRKITPTGVVTTLAGSAGVSGSTDATGSAAQFYYPGGVAVDASGYVYVADRLNNTIRRITPTGVVTTLAGKAGSYGSIDGAGSAARFNGPSGVAVDTSGNVYVSDPYNHTVRKITPVGVVTTLAGMAGTGGTSDGTGSAALFYAPSSVAVDSAGNVYVTDDGIDPVLQSNTIRKITPAGTVTTLAGLAGPYGYADGSGSAARFESPNGVAVDSTGNVYVADGSQTIRQGSLTVIAGGTPAITTQPVSQTVSVSYQVTFTVAATGAPPPTYQWQKNGTNITGATGNSYTITSAGTTDAGTYTVVVANSSGSVTSQNATLTVVPHSTVAIGADFNGDGKSDLLWQNSLTGAIGTWLMNGTIAPSVSVSAIPDYPWILPEWSVAATGDFNADGRTDLVWQNNRTGERAIWLMNGTAFTGIALGTFDLAWSIATAGDFNGDGKPDLVWQNIVTGERAIWLMNGTTLASSVSLGTYDTVWSIAATGDFNGDGKTDLVWQNTVTGEKSIWLMNGTTLTAGVSLGTYPQLEIDATGDFNGDGQTDIVWTNKTTGERGIWLMNGTTIASTVSLGVVSLDWTLHEPWAPPPAITSLSSTRLVLIPGQSSSLTVTATGTGGGALGYQWSRNGHAIAGATSGTLALSNVTYQDSGYYLVDVTDTHGTVRSAPIFVTVAPAYSQVRAWGANSTALATIPANLTDAIALSAASSNSSTNISALALNRDGTVVVLGGTAASPALTPPAGLNNVVAVSAGDTYALALKSDGTVVAWGVGQPGQTTVPAGLTNAVAISTSRVYSYALKSDGTVVQWGTQPAHQTDVTVGLTQVVAMNFGGGRMLALMADGTVVSRSQSEFSSAVPVPTSLANVVAVAAGGGFSLALKNDGTVAAWSELFQPDATAPAGLAGVVGIAAGSDQALALKSDGTVVAWGGNTSGEATLPGDLTNVFAIAAGNNFSLALIESTAPVPPVITTQPSGQIVTAGYPVTFTAAATTTGLTYQWQKNGTNITGATGSSYTIASAVAGDAGSYTVVVTNSTGTVTSSAAVLTVRPAPASTYRPAMDFNSDRKSDLIWQNSVTGERSIALMNGTTSTTSVSLGVSPSEWSIAAVADFNGDGQPDLVWQNSLTGERAFWLMNGTSFMASASLGTVATDWSIAGARDFNGDGHPDLVWQNTSTGERSIWLMNGTTLGSVVNLGAFPPEWSIAGTGDFNADGQTDLVWQNTVTGEKAVWLMNGTTVTQGVALGVYPHLQISGTGDYNGDGQTDIVWTNISTGERGIWLMNGTTIASTVSLGVVSLDLTLDRPVFRRALSDFNNDGKSDLVWQNTTTGDRAVWLMNGTQARTGLSLGNYPTNQWIAAVGDFNNDGKADLVWQNTTTGERSIMLMNGTTVLSTIVLGTYDTAWSIVTTGDFNGDDKPDLVWQNSVTGERAIWLMDGTAFTGGVALGAVSTQLQIVGTGDFNGDGQTDIVWQNTATGERSVWLMNGTTFSANVSLGTVDPVWSIVGTGDYNGDGKPDLLWQNTATGERRIWLMDGTTFLSSVTIGTYDTNWSIRN